MELRHLRYVVTLAETLHFGRAAERLHLSQPPLSHQVRQLEEELRIKLFHRTKRQVQLTEAGRMFVQEARIILAQAAHAANLASRIDQGEVGQLTMGVAGPAEAASGPLRSCISAYCGSWASAAAAPLVAAGSEASASTRICGWS